MKPKAAAVDRFSPAGGAARWAAARRGGWLCALIVWLLAGSMVGPVAAQEYIRSTWPTHEPTVVAADIADMGRSLRLDSDQVEAIEALHQGYLEAFHAARDQMNAEQEALKDEARERQRQDPTVWRETAPRLNVIRDRWAEDRDSLERTFFDDVKLLLSDAQQANWARFERERRRRTTLDFGARFSGEEIDLVGLIDTQMELSQELRARIDDDLERYAAAIDISLVLRNQAIEESQRLLVDRQTERGTGMFDQIDQHRIAIRDTNERFLDVIAGQLPAAEADRLRRIFQSESYPRILRPTQAQDYVERALALETLSDEQRRSIESIRSAFARDFDGINARLIAIERERDDARAAIRREGNNREGVISDRRVAEQANEARDLWRRRHELDSNVVDRIFATLTPDQRLAAPKRAMPTQYSGGNWDDQSAGNR